MGQPEAVMKSAGDDWLCWRRGVVALVVSTKLLYVEPG